MRALRVAAIAVFSLLAAGFAGAQADAPASNPGSAMDQAAPRRILISFQRSRYAGYSSEEIGVLKQSFLLVLSQADGAPSPVDYGTKAFPGRPADRDKAARDVGADCWLLATIEGPRGRPKIRVISHDLLYTTTSVDLAVSRREPFAMMDVYRERWDEIVPLVVKAYPPLDPAAYAQGPPPAVTLTVRALPGTEISGLSARPVTVGADGTVSVDLASPAPYSLRAVLGGYLPSLLSFYYQGEKEITLTQTRPPWLFLDLAFLDGFYPGVSATVASSPFPGFLRVGYTTFRLGIAIGDKLFSSLPLSQLTLLAGIYLSPEDASTRMYFGAGPLVRFSLPPSGSLVFDQLLPWGVQAVVGFEFTLVPKLRFVVEYAPTLYATPLPDFFDFYFSGNDSGTFPYIKFPPSFALDILEVRMGLRWAL
jgi:hypothetical protein